MMDKRYLVPLVGLVVAAGCGGNPNPGVARGDPCDGARVRLYEDAGFSDRVLTIDYPEEFTSLRAAGADAGDGDLNDRASSVQWTIPIGCQLVLYEDENFRGARFPLVGSSRSEQNSNLGSFNDRASSARWERT